MQWRLLPDCQANKIKRNVKVSGEKEKNDPEISKHEAVDKKSVKDGMTDRQTREDDSSHGFPSEGEVGDLGTVDGEKKDPGQDADDPEVSWTKKGDDLELELDQKPGQ